MRHENPKTIYKKNSDMKTKIVTLIFILLSFTIVILMSSKDKSPIVERAIEGLPVAEFTLTDVNANPITLSNLKGKALLIKFWASWCDTCKEEMPKFQKFYDNNKTNPAINIITIIYQDKQEKALKFMNDNKYNFPIYIDEDGTSASIFGVTGVPETYLIDKNGVLFRRIIGPFKIESEKALKLIAELLKRT
ncbi:peroxiredoxin [Candidatus Magnetoovum chiemensis]|nr:peroxiredoxin [Candidatus Magnetoovum chiemensis]